MDATEFTALAVNNTREFIKDTGHQAPDENHILALLQIPPISDEVAEMENEASTRRMAEVEHLLPAMNSFSKLFATGSVLHEQAHLPEEVAEHLPEGIMQAQVDSLHVFGVQLLLGTLSQFVARGFLVLPTKPEPVKRRRLFRRG